MILSAVVEVEQVVEIMVAGVERGVVGLLLAMAQRSARTGKIVLTVNVNLRVVVQELRDAGEFVSLSRVWLRTIIIVERVDKNVYRANPVNKDRARVIPLHVLG